MYNRIKGYSLLELSVVIVMIGILVAGTAAGANLIKSAKLNRQILQFNEVRTVYSTFKTSYKSAPGDMRYAFSYWGTAMGCTNNYIGSDLTGCNGDGDGVMQGLGNIMEVILAWRHLFAAGLWNTDVTVPAGGNGIAKSGLSVPKASLGGATAIYFSSSVHDTTLRTAGILTVNYDSLQMGVDSPGATGYPTYSALSGVDTKNIDTKIDDGKPLTGKFFAFTAANNPSGAACLNGTGTGNITGATEYNLANASSLSCTMQIILN